MFDVVVLTESKYVDASPIEGDWYLNNVLQEDQLVMDAIAKLGLRVCKKDWADPEFDWSSTKSILFRTTWDYFHRYDEFRLWLDSVKTKTRLFNSALQIVWNVDKHYLQDLDRYGINVPTSFFIEKGEHITLAELVSQHSLEKFVLKPCVSGAARHTYLINKAEVADHEAIFAELIAQEAMMVQAFIESIKTKGEISLMVIGGKFTHAVLKIAKPGDFRVQDDFGGTVHDYDAQADEIAFAEKVVHALPEMPAYARVDLVWDNHGDLSVSELEMIEPELWFRMNPNAADELARFIHKELNVPYSNVTI